MKLPQSEVPQFEVTLPVTSKKIKYRPFLVKEQKVLLIALQSGDKKDILNAISTMMDSCVINHSKFKSIQLPLLDFEYLFLKMRCVSYSEYVELKYLCKNLVETVIPNVENSEKMEQCGNIVSIGLNLNSIVLPTIDPKANKIILSENPILGITLKYPSYELMENSKDEIKFEETIEMIKNCIESVFDLQNIYTKEQYTPEELDEWFDALDQMQFDKILHFFNNIPVLKTDLKFHCRECGHKEVIHLEGIQSFFV